jgi:hypothetical protein
MNAASMRAELAAQCFVLDVLTGRVRSTHQNRQIVARYLAACRGQG